MESDTARTKKEAQAPIITAVGSRYGTKSTSNRSSTWSAGVVVVSVAFNTRLCIQSRRCKIEGKKRI